VSFTDVSCYFISLSKKTVWFVKIQKVQPILTVDEVCPSCVTYAQTMSHLNDSVGHWWWLCPLIVSSAIPEGTVTDLATCTWFTDTGSDCNSWYAAAKLLQIGQISCYSLNLHLKANHRTRRITFIFSFMPCRLCACTQRTRLRPILLLR